MSYDTDEAEAVEFVLFADNTYPVYKRQEAFHAALAKKLAAGTYDHAQAVKLWGYYAEEVVRAFDEEANAKRKGTGSLTVTTKKVRDVIAHVYADEFQAKVKAGEFDGLITASMTKKRKRELGVA